jgi:Protein of unknown function (DUF4238)
VTTPKTTSPPPPTSRGWTADGRLARVLLEGSGESELKKPQRVGFRRRFFTDRRIARHAEARLGVYESEGIRALERIRQSWPPDDQTRLDLAKLVAVHMARNPASIEATIRMSKRAIAENIEAYRHELSEKQVRELLSHLTSEAFRVDHILDLIPKHASLVASMHWTLLEFPEPLLATSDQPVTVMPILPEGTVARVTAMPSTGFLMTEEARFALDPWRALIFTWMNDIDSQRPVIAPDDFAAELNRAAIAQADREWFHHPDRRATRLKQDDLDVEVCGSLGCELLPEYTTNAALESPRRLHAGRLLQRMIDQQITSEFHVARVRRADP